MTVDSTCPFRSILAQGVIALYRNELPAREIWQRTSQDSSRCEEIRTEALILARLPVRYLPNPLKPRQTAAFFWHKRCDPEIWDRWYVQKNKIEVSL